VIRELQHLFILRDESVKLVRGRAIAGMQPWKTGMIGSRTLTLAICERHRGVHIGGWALTARLRGERKTVEKKKIKID